MPQRLIDIVSPYYQDLLSYCENSKISINLDFQNLTISIKDNDCEKIKAFLATEIRRAIKNCKSGDKITLAESDNENSIRITVKNSGAETLSQSVKEKLIKKGYEVRARFGYDTIISLKLDR